MNNKGFADNQSSIETPNDAGLAEKPLKTDQIKSNRVDINVLKSKLQETESKEFKKNIVILSSLVLALGVLGIYLSLWVKFANLSFRCFNMNVKNTATNIKEQIVSRYLTTNKSIDNNKSTDINILLNRIKTNNKNESRRKLYFSAAASTGLILFGLIIF